MALQKLICTQCGSNELKVVSATVFECESCGTILKEEKSKEVPQPPLIQEPKIEKPFRSQRQFTVLDEPAYGDEDRQEVADSKQAATFIIVLIAAVILGLVLLFAS